MNHSVPWTRRIFELLADGPLPLEYVIAEVRNMVPPGRAYRQAEKKRKQQAARRVNKTDRKAWVRPPTEDETIRTGQRQIVMDSVTKLVRTGRLRYIEGHIEGDPRSLALGREPETGGMSPDHPFIKKLNEHQITFTKWAVPDIANAAGRPIYAVNGTCSCGEWEWIGAHQDPDGDWHVWSTTKDQVKIEFTKHRRSFV